MATDELLERHDDFLRAILRDLEPDQRVVFHERRCKFIRKGRCTCNPVIIDRMPERLA